MVNVLKKASVTTVQQVLRCYPRKYQEYARWRGDMELGTSVLVQGTVVSYLKGNAGGRWGGYKQPATLAIETEDGVGGVATFEAPLWAYVPQESERMLVPGAYACVRGLAFFRELDPSARRALLRQDNRMFVPTFKGEHDAHVAHALSNLCHLVPHLFGLGNLGHPALQGHDESALRHALHNQPQLTSGRLVFSHCTTPGVKRA